MLRLRRRVHAAGRHQAGTAGTQGAPEPLHRSGRTGLVADVQDGDGHLVQGRRRAARSSRGGEDVAQRGEADVLGVFGSARLREGDEQRVTLRQRRPQRLGVAGGVLALRVEEVEAEAGRGPHLCGAQHGARARACSEAEDRDRGPGGGGG